MFMFPNTVPRSTASHRASHTEPHSPCPWKFEGQNPDATKDCSSRPMTQSPSAPHTHTHTCLSLHLFTQSPTNATNQVAWYLLRQRSTRLNPNHSVFYACTNETHFLSATSYAKQATHPAGPAGRAVWVSMAPSVSEVQHRAFGELRKWPVYLPQRLYSETGGLTPSAPC